MKKNNLFYISILCYCISMLLPVTEWHWDFLGVQIFFSGILAITSSESELLFTVPLLANLAYILNLLLRDKNIVIRVAMSLCAIIFSFFALRYFRFPFQERGMFEAYIGPGFLFWILSFILMLVSQVKEYKNLKTKKKS